MDGLKLPASGFKRFESTLTATAAFELCEAGGHTYLSSVGDACLADNPTKRSLISFAKIRVTVALRPKTTKN